MLRNLELRRDNPPDFNCRSATEPLGTDRRRQPGLSTWFPKTLSLAELIDRKLPSGITLALYVDTPVEFAELRVSRRLVCNVCHRSFPSGSVELGDACPCDARAGRIIRRADDLGNSERRIRESGDSLKLQAHYEAHGRLAVLDGSLRIEPLEATAIEAITARVGSLRAVTD